MERSNMYRFGLVLIGVGIIIGLLVSAGFDLTKSSDATVSNSVEELTQSEPTGQDESSAIAGIATLEQLSAAFANVAEKVNPAVVTVFTETVIPAGNMANHPFQEFFGDEFFKRFFGPPNREYKQQGLGSGVIVSEDGIIITNNHVVDKANDIKVRLMDGTEYKAEVKGKDSRTDLAILKIDAKNLPNIKFGDSDKARVGSWVLAIGSPLSPELAHTVTSGIVSAKGRSGLGLNNIYQDYIQTDAAINRGNSGGALVNLRGELIGINAAIISNSGGFIGIGFAIPSNLAKKVMTDIVEKGRVVRGWMGVYIQNLNKDIAKGLGLDKPDGVIISSIQENSPAEKAGLKTEDVVREIDGKPVKNSTELSTRVASAGPGKEVTLTILRDGKEKKVVVKLEEYPEDMEELVADSQTAEKIGMTVSDISSELIRKFDLKVKKNGVVITDVVRGGVANRQDLRPGDVILKLNRKPVKNVRDYDKLMKDVKAGDTVLLYLQRGEARIFAALNIPE